MVVSLKQHGQIKYGPVQKGPDKGGVQIAMAKVITASTVVEMDM